MSAPRIIEVKWEGFPLPPSSNNMYATVGKRRIKSVQMRQFESAVLRWSYARRKGIDWMMAAFKDLEATEAIRIDATFYFERSRILCKDGTPKRNDTSNRIKALHDVISELTGIDDSWFWSGSFDKFPVDHVDEEGVTIWFHVEQVLNR